MEMSREDRPPAPDSAIIILEANGRNSDWMVQILARRASIADDQIRGDAEAFQAVNLVQQAPLDAGAHLDVFGEFVTGADGDVEVVPAGVVGAEVEQVRPFEAQRLWMAVARVVE